MNEKLMGLVSKKLGFALLAGWAVHEMAKLDPAHSVQYAWMITAMACIYMAAEIVCKFAPQNSPGSRVKSDQ